MKKRIRKTWLLMMLVICMTLFHKNFLTEANAASAKLNKTGISLYVGQQYQLSVKGFTGTAKWTSSNRKVAQISNTGIVTAKKIGTARISVKVGRKTLRCKVTVKPTKASLDQTKLTVPVNETATLQVNNASYTPKVTLSKSQKKLMTVTRKGMSFVIKGKKKGTATITVKVGKQKLKCRIRIDNSQIDNSQPAASTGTEPVTPSTKTNQADAPYRTQKITAGGIEWNIEKVSNGIADLIYTYDRQHFDLNKLRVEFNNGNATNWTDSTKMQNATARENYLAYVTCLIDKPNATYACMYIDPWLDNSIRVRVYADFSFYKGLSYPYTIYYAGTPISAGTITTSCDEYYFYKEAAANAEKAMWTSENLAGYSGKQLLDRKLELLQHYIYENYPYSKVDCIIGSRIMAISCLHLGVLSGDGNQSGKLAFGSLHRAITLGVASSPSDNIHHQSLAIYPNGMKTKQMFGHTVYDNDGTNAVEYWDAQGHY